MTRFARLEASRIARGAWDPTDAKHRAHPEAKGTTNAFHRTDYAVAKVYEAGKVDVLKGHVNLTSFEADARAGRLRDEMSDDEVGTALKEGWTYAVVTVRGNQRKTQRWAWEGK